MMPIESEDTTPATAGVSSITADVSVELAVWWQQARAVAYDQLELITLEGERVATSMVALLVFSMLAGLLLLTLWLAAVAQIIVLALYTGLPLLSALGLAMVMNLLGLWLVLSRCRYYSSLLRFSATLQSLRKALDNPAGAD